MPSRFHFRAWDASERQMVEWPSLVHDPDGYLLRLLLGESPEDVLMQSTGLKDKNGREIFEGDILETRFMSGPIRFPMKWNSDEGAWTRFVPLNQYEVIGNIHENPDLLPSAA